MGKRYEDIDSENLHIAQMLKKDSEQIKDKGIDENIIEQIRDYESPKRNVYKMVTAVAACVVLCVTIFAWKNIGLQTDSVVADKTIKETKVSLNSDKNVRLAKGYYEIDKRIKEMVGPELEAAKDERGLLTEKSKSANGMEALTDTTSMEYSKTNQQTENVDESDVVKTDGRYIYTLSSKMDDAEKKTAEIYDVCWIGMKYKLTITAVDGKQMEKISSINIEDKDIKVFDSMEMYISGDTLVLVGGFVENNKQEGMSTCIYTYDISNRKEIRLKNKNVQDGSYHSSRMVDGYLYTISDYSLWSCKEEACVPKINGKKMNYSCIYIPEKIKDERPEYTVITALDIRQSEDFTSNISILGGVNDIYVSQNNIYLLNRYCDTKDITKTKKGKEILENQKEKDKYKVEKNSDYTKITKYSYKDGVVNYVASANLLGRIDDQFSLDEKDGYLRMVVHENNIISGNLYRTHYDAENKEKETYLVDTLDNEEIESWNDVYVLGANLEVVSSIKGLAKNEEIYAARFLRDYGYFVSFENTDPLFTIDFSDIKNPKVAGELKMPGFSDYLQFYNDDLLLGIGQNGDDNGQTDELKIDMYDVKKGKATLITKQILKNYDYSEAFYNYKAVLVDSKKELIGFYADKNSGSYETNYLLYTYKNNKFKKVLEIPIGKYVEDIRGLYIGDYFYIVNPERKIIAIDLKNYKKVSEIKIK